MQMAIGLTFPGELQDESIICALCKNFDISLKIIEASFSMASGWAILQIIGEQQEMEKAFEFLRSKKVRVQQIEVKS